MSLCPNLEGEVSYFQLLKWGEGALKNAKRPDAAIDAKLLMRYLLKCSEMELLLEWRKPASSKVKAQYEKLVEKRSEGIPLQHITGTQEFMGLEFKVNEKVLIPRQDTETLVETLIKENRKEHFKTGIDIGTGSGCISISLMKAIEGLTMTGIDISKDALKIAEENAVSHHVKERFMLVESDVFDSYSPIAKVDFVVSNPPYISIEETQELMMEVIDHEPRIALTDEGDGLAFYRRISKEAKIYLRTEGILAYEIGCNQAEAVSQILEGEGYQAIQVIQDLTQKDRVVMARRG